MKNPTHEQNALSKEIGCGGSALWNLTGGLRDYHKLFFDSIALLEKLETRNIYACGTIKSNRKSMPINFPTDR